MRLRDLRQWVCWKYVVRQKQKTKRPVKTSGASASTTDPATWCSFEDAVSAFRSNGEFAGIGFVFTNDDSFVGIDLDDCIDESGELLREARDIIDTLASYAEVSPSGHGVKLIIRSDDPPFKRGREIKPDTFTEIGIYPICVLQET